MVTVIRLRSAGSTYWQ